MNNVEESDYGTYKCKDSNSEDEATLEVASKCTQLILFENFKFIQCIFEVFINGNVNLFSKT